MTVKKTLQELLRPIIAEHLEYRRRYFLEWIKTVPRHRDNSDKPRRVKYPWELTMVGLADSYGLTSRTFQRWVNGEVQDPKRLDAVELIRADYHRIMKTARRTLGSFGGNVGLWSSAIDSAAYRLDFKHGMPTGKIYTVAWPSWDIADLVYDVASDGYKVMFLIYNPFAKSDEIPIPGGYFTSGWLIYKKDMSSSKIELDIKRKWLIKGEIHAVLFSLPKQTSPKEKQHAAKKPKGHPRRLH